MDITQMHIPVMRSRRSGKKHQKTTITVHNTGNPNSTAKNERDWLVNPNNARAASWHLCVDEKDIIEAIPLDEEAYHSGTTEGNQSSIGIEICESGDYGKTEERAAELIAQILRERGWGIDRVKKHQDWSGKYCPRKIIPYWGDFLRRIEAKLGTSKPRWGAEAIETMTALGLTDGTRMDDLATRKEMVQFGYNLLRHLGAVQEPRQEGKSEYQRIGATHVVKINPAALSIIIPNSRISSVQEGNALNGTFFWQGKPNGILISGGKTLCEAASHAWRGFPQSVIYLSKSGEVRIARIRSASEIDAIWALGGLGILTPYGYDPAKEGFSGAYSDVLRQTNKTFLGYKKSENKIYLCLRPDSSHERIIQSCKNLGLDFAISLDGGGSSSIKVDGKVLVSGDGRAVNNYITWR